MNNSKVIRLHKGCFNNENNNKINIGIIIELIIHKINKMINNKISYIKCTYEVKDINNDIQIINNGVIKTINEELESKIKILNGDKKEKLILRKNFIK